MDGVEDVIAIFQAVRDVVEQPFIVEGHDVSISASVGIALYPDDGVDVDSLVSYADKAMYEVKQRRHNTYSCPLKPATAETSKSLLALIKPFG